MSSNRYKHLIAGLIIFVCFMGLNSIFQMGVLVALLNSYAVVLACMLTAEYKDKLHGGAFDLEDVAAGMIAPFIIIIISVLFLIF